MESYDEDQETPSGQADGTVDVEGNHWVILGKKWRQGIRHKEDVVVDVVNVLHYQGLINAPELNGFLCSLW